jgi:hypothetical protein
MDDFESHYDLVMRTQPDIRRLLQVSLRNPAYRNHPTWGAGLPDATLAVVAVMGNFALTGQQVYMLGPVMQEALGHTDSGTITKELFRLPHNTFYLALPSMDLSINADGHVLPVKGAYIMADGDSLEVIVCGFGGGEMATLEGRISLRGSLVNGEVVLDLEQRALATTPFDGGAVVQGNNEALGQVVRLAVNMIRYLHCKRSETVVYTPTPNPLRGGMTPKKAAKLARRQGNQLRPRITIIAPTIEQNGKLSGVAGSGSSKSPHIRAGHFHTYWYGSTVDPVTGNARKGEYQEQLWVMPILVNGSLASPPSANPNPRRYKFAA